ncbi:hypothetical protein KI387_017348, partial [Taxus chinensis]
RRSQTVIGFIMSSSSSSSQDPSYLWHAFTVLDRDGNGKISSSDLHEFFTISLKKHVSKEDIESMINAADLDRKGYVGFEEFERIVTSFKGKKCDRDASDYVESPEQSTLMEIFEAIDRDGDGIISLGDLREFMGFLMQVEEAEDHVSERELVEMIKIAGGSASSGICKQDFMAMMKATIMKMNHPNQ